MSLEMLKSGESELGEREMSFGMQLGELGKTSIGMLNLVELGEMIFGVLQLGELGEMSFGTIA